VALLARSRLGPTIVYLLAMEKYIDILSLFLVFGRKVLTIYLFKEMVMRLSRVVRRGIRGPLAS